MAVVNTWAGRLSHDGVRVVAKLSGVASARLAVDTDPAFSAPDFFGPTTPDSQDVVRVDAAGLDPGTTYFYAIEEDSVLNTGTTGSFTTFDDAPGNPVSFTFASTGDAGASPDFPDTTGQVLAPNRVANPPVCDDIRLHEKNPRFVLHMGDITYYDPGSGVHVPDGSLGTYIRMHDDVLLQSRQHELYRNVPIWYCWDDHDYGPNNSDGTLPTKQNAADAYRIKVPSEVLVDTGAIYQSKRIGRVLMVMLDTRFYRSPNSDPDGPNKTMLGQAQKDWLADLLASSSAEALIVISSVRWLNGSNDSWPGFVTERQEIADLFTSTGWADRMIMLNADAHTVALDSGANNQWGGFPVYVTAPLDAGPSSISSGYDIGISNQRAQYGIVEVADDGEQIVITTTGYVNDDALFSHTFTVVTEVEPEPEPEPEPPPPFTIAEEFVGEPHYTYTFGQARSGLVTAEIPMFGVSMNTVLNGPYDFMGSFIADVSGVSNRDLQNATEPGRTFVVVERDGFPVWDGNLSSRVYQAQAKSYQTFARSLSAYPYRVKMDEDYFPNGFVVENVEQTEAYLLLWETLQSKPESNLRVLLPPPLSTGVAVTMNVQPYEDKSFGDVMDEIANGANGFDVRITTRKVDNEYVRVMQIGHPVIGQTDSNRLVFEYPGPMMNYWRTDGVNSAGTHIHGLGSGQGEDMLRHKVVHQDLIDGGYLRWDHDVQLKEVTSQAVLNSLTQGAAIVNRLPRKVYAVEMHGGEEPEFGTYLQGDACTLKFEDPAHPGGVRFPTRIIGWRLAPPSKDSVEKVSVFFEGGAEGGF